MNTYAKCDKYGSFEMMRSKDSVPLYWFEIQTRSSSTRVCSFVVCPKCMVEVSAALGFNCTEQEGREEYR